MILRYEKNENKFMFTLFFFFFLYVNKQNFGGSAFDQLKGLISTKRLNN